MKHTKAFDFMEIMLEKHCNVPIYIFKNHFYAIEAFDE